MIDAHRAHFNAQVCVVDEPTAQEQKVMASSLGIQRLIMELLINNEIQR